MVGEIAPVGGCKGPHGFSRQRSQAPRWRWGYAAGLLAAGLLAGTWAGAAPADPAPVSPPLPATGVIQLYAAGASADPLGPGDLIDVRIFGQPQLSGALRVAANGTIDPPFLGPVEAAGQTPAALAARLQQRYRRWLRHPWVSVRVLEVNSRTVAITGAVPRPGVYAFSGRLTLLRALAMAGGIDPERTSRHLFLLHHPPLETSAGGGVLRLHARTVLERIDWRKLQADPEADRRLAPGDLIEVPPAHRVFITGEVRRAGAARLRPRMTLSELISEAGGLLAQAQPGAIRILRLGHGGARQRLVYSLSAIRAGKAVDPRLEADDIVVVPNSVARAVGLELIDFFSGSARWRLQNDVLDTLP